MRVLGQPVENAVRKLAVDLPEIERASSLRHPEMHEHFSSLEETQPLPQIQFQDHTQLIRF